MSKERIEHLAGTHFQLMMRSVEEAEGYLKSSDPCLREAALYVLYHHWRQGDAYSPRYETIAMTDSNVDVRAEAFVLLGFCYSYTRDRRVSNLMARIVLDSNQDDKLRLAAYHALLRTHGQIETSMLFLKFPDKVNWSFVESCMAQST
jgi:hypothetical protein